MSTAEPENMLDRYCTTCGTLLVEGACPECALTASAPSEHHRTPRSTVATVAAVGILALGLLQQHQELHQVRRQQAAAERRTAQLGRRLGEAEAAAARTKSQLVNLDARVAAMDAATKDAPSTSKTAAEAQKSVFTVQTDEKLGTAWVIETSPTTSTLVTNAHVVSPLTVGDQVDVVRDDLTFQARITYINDDHDLALVVTEHPFPALDVETTKPAPGDAVLVVGSPLGLGGSVATGVVSAVRVEKGTELIQFTAPISPGSSGGPVLNDQGDVVGIAVEKVVDAAAEGLGFAIPVEQLCRDTPAC